MNGSSLGDCRNLCFSCNLVWGIEMRKFSSFGLCGTNAWEMLVYIDITSLLLNQETPLRAKPSRTQIGELFFVNLMLLYYERLTLLLTFTVWWYLRWMYFTLYIKPCTLQHRDFFLCETCHATYLFARIESKFLFFVSFCRRNALHVMFLIATRL